MAEEKQKLRRAFLVVGAESSGTKMMAQILIRSGCKGTSGDNQPMADFTNAAKEQGDIVVRYSFPHMRVWPDLQYMIRKYRMFGFEVVVLVMMRQWWPMMESQSKRGHVADQSAALANIQRAYYLMFYQMDQANANMVIVSYEDLVLNPGFAIPRLCAMLRLPNPDPFPQIRNENKKHYEEFARRQKDESEASEKNPAGE